MALAVCSYNLSLTQQFFNLMEQYGYIVKIILQSQKAVEYLYL